MAEDDKSDLHELSQCLNQAGSLIEAILKHPEHRSSSSQSTSTERTPVTAQLIQNERQREFSNILMTRIINLQDVALRV